jgi:hypothetical protein
MESSIAVFLERQSACELLPTESETKTLQKENLRNTSFEKNAQHPFPALRHSE